MTFLLERDLHCPRAHGVGRLFDGVAALALARPRASYEGQLAMAWNHTASDGGASPSPVLLSHGDPWVIDTRPMVRALVDDLRARADLGVVSARFHATIVAATAQILRARAGDLPILLTGGCFVNPLLAQGLLGELRDKDVRLQRAVPPGDGGLALGQMAVASCV